MLKCKICGQECGPKGISSHLKRKHQLASKEYYDNYLKKEQEGLCKICGKLTTFDTILAGYRPYCSSKCANLDPNIRTKIEQTTINKYRVKCNLNLEEIKIKAKTNSQTKEAKEKRANTNIEKYSAANPYASKVIIDKMKQNNLDKFGVEYSWQRPDVKEHIKQTNLKRYGVEAIAKSDIVKQHFKENRIKNIDNFLKENDCITRQKVIDMYGTGWLYVDLGITIINKHNKAFIKKSDLPKIQQYAEINHYQSSKFEHDIIDYVQLIYKGEIINNTRDILKPYELDVYIPEKKIAIECNGSYWHDETRKGKKYHFNKSKACQEKGIRLIHIYEWEWLKYPEKIKQLLNIALGSVSRIYARQCKVRVIDNKIAKPFNDATHLQGHRNAQVTYGLYYNNELVQLMSFSKTKYNRNLGENEWEIIRGCPGSNNIVVGGVSKLFKHFVEDYKPNRVFSYCDFNKFDGKSYLALGMTFIGYTGPNKWWIIDRNTVIERNPKHYQELKNNDKIWGSGSLKFEWRKV